MFKLIEPRKEFPCKTKRKQGYGNCDQMLYLDPKKKSRSGKTIPLNAVDGRGGAKGDPHVCPDRLDSEFDHTNRNVDWGEYHLSQMEKLCPSCAQTFDSYRNPLCPTCFKLECRKCGNLQQWINSPKVDNNKCNMCGAIGLDVRQVFHSYERLYGKNELN